MPQETELPRRRPNSPQQPHRFPHNSANHNNNNDADVTYPHVPIAAASTQIHLQNASSRAQAIHRHIPQQQGFDGATSPGVPTYVKISTGRRNNYTDSDDDDDYEEYEKAIQELSNYQSIPKQKDENQKETCLEKLDKRFSHMVNIESSVADSEDFPVHW
jgi:hypothetical protein